jgi:opacity protein-like surface antigen
VARVATVSAFPATLLAAFAAAFAAALLAALLAALAAAATMMAATGHLKLSIGQIGQKAIGFDQQFGNSDVRHCVFSLFKKLNPTNQVSIVFYGGLKD